MKKIVIVYELLKREMTNIALLRNELKKRGYKVILKSKSESISSRKCDLLVVPNCYNTGDYLDYLYRFPSKHNLMLNLQCEQIMSLDYEKEKKWMADGLSQNAKFICWGTDRHSQLLNCGVCQDNLYIAGAIQTDTLRSKFVSLWKSKEQLAHDYNIPFQKTWTLFISSFSLASKDSTLVKFMKSVDGEAEISKISDYSAQMQLIILNWLEKSLTDSNHIIIYRPHPTEERSTQLLELARKYPNRFYIIGDLDIKQWIMACDNITMWNSTSLIECFYAHKNCVIMQPDVPPDELRYSLFDYCNKVTTYDDFKTALDLGQTNFVFPISECALGKYYYLSDNYVYSGICDIIDRLLKDKKCAQKEFNSFQRLKYKLGKHLYIKVIFKKVYGFAHSVFGITIRNAKLRDKYFIHSWETAKLERKQYRQMQKTIDNILK